MDLGSLDVARESRNAITELRNEAARENPQGLMKEYGAGTDKAKGLISTDESFNEGLGSPDKAMLKAVQNKYQTQYAGDFSQIANRNLKSAQTDHLRKLETATNLASQELEMNRQKEILAYKMKQAKKAMRGKILGTVLGIAGAGAGAAYGGPAGAMAGGQLGMGVGQAVGSS